MNDIEYLHGEIEMHTFKIKGSNATVLKAFITVLARHHNVTVDIRKQSWHRTVEVSVRGSGEKGFSEDMTKFCSQLGWKIEYLHELSK